jgi:transposase
MCAPAPASASAVARPMPRDAPVTSATFSASGFDMAIFKSDHRFSAIEPEE